MSWFSNNSNTASPITPACNCRPPSRPCRFRLSGAGTSSPATSSGISDFIAVRVRRRQGFGRQGRPSAAETGHGYTYQADLIMGLCEGPIAASASGRTCRSTRRSSSTADLQRNDAAKRLAVARRSIRGRIWPTRGPPSSAPPPTTSDRAAAIGNHNFEIVGRARRNGGQWHRRRPGPGDLRLPDQRPIWRGLQSRPRSTGRPVRLGGRCEPADLLPGDGAGLLAGSDRPGAGLEHPDALAANPVLRGRVERGPAQIHSLRRLGDFERRDDGNAAIFDSLARSGLERLSDPLARHCRGRRSFASDGGVVFASTGFPLVFVGAPTRPFPALTR